VRPERAEGLTEDVEDVAHSVHYRLGNGGPQPLDLGPRIQFLVLRMRILLSGFDPGAQTLRLPDSSPRSEV